MILKKISSPIKSSTRSNNIAKKSNVWNKINRLIQKNKKTKKILKLFNKSITLLPYLPNVSDAFLTCIKIEAYVKFFSFFSSLKMFINECLSP